MLFICEAFHVTLARKLIRLKTYSFTLEDNDLTIRSGAHSDRMAQNDYSSFVGLLPFETMVSGPNDR
jgi:hypothetical protein